MGTKWEHIENKGKMKSSSSSPNPKRKVEVIAVHDAPSHWCK
jgi:hypothetical protein